MPSRAPGRWRPAAPGHPASLAAFPGQPQQAGIADGAERGAQRRHQRDRILQRQGAQQRLAVLGLTGGQQRAAAGVAGRDAFPGEGLAEAGQGGPAAGQDRDVTGPQRTPVPSEGSKTSRPSSSSARIRLATDPASAACRCALERLTPSSSAAMVQASRGTLQLSLTRSA